MQQKEELQASQVVEFNKLLMGFSDQFRDFGKAIGVDENCSVKLGARKIILFHKKLLFPKLLFFLFSKLLRGSKPSTFES